LESSPASIAETLLDRRHHHVDPLARTGTAGEITRPG
jgi:hypothetical protein